MGIFNKTYFSKVMELENNDFVDINSNVSYSDIARDGYTVQGFILVDKYMIISAYSKFISGRRNKSRLYFYGYKTGDCEGYVELDNSSHVGGIAYDKVNNILYVTGSYGKVNAYSFNSILSVLNDSGKLEKYDSSNLDISLVLKGNVSAATIYFYDGCLYVATCSNVGRVVKYKVRYSDEKILVDEYKVEENAPACIQGICVFDYEKSRYYLVSQSYGKSKSTIKVLDEKFNFIGQVILSITGIEGIDISKSGNIYAVFENSSTKVVCKHLSKLGSRCSKSLEEKYVSYGKIHQNILDARDKVL